jgi:hypothetical protein
MLPDQSHAVGIAHSQQQSMFAVLANRQNPVPTVLYHVTGLAKKADAVLLQ